MIILGNFIIALANILDLALTIYSFIIIIGAVLSWVNLILIIQLSVLYME